MLIQLGKLLDADPYFDNFVEDIPVDLTTAMQTFELVVTIDNPLSLNADLIFSLGAGLATDVTLDNISITEYDAEDTEAPVITLLGESTVNIDNGAVYVDPGVTITDNVDTGLVVVVGGDSVNSAVDGTYVVTYNVTDAAGNAATEVTRTVIVSSDDLVAPIITLVGASSVTVNLNDSYVEPGATASDNVDGDITANIIVDDSNVDTSIVGVYTVTYNVVDAAGNNATEIQRQVNVIDPSNVIVKNGGFDNAIVPTEWVLQEGAGTITIVDGELVVEGIAPGAAYQPRLVQGDLVLVPGTQYKLSFDARVAEARSITVQLGELLSGAPWFNTFTDDTIVPLTTTMGTHEIVFTASANAANSGDLIFALGAGVSTTVTFDNIAITEITDADIAPVITLLGDANVVISVGDSYVDAGVTAQDNLDGDVTANVIINNPVDETTAGTYIVTYDVTDSDGNAAAQMTRTVNVVEGGGVTNLIPNGDFSLGKASWEGNYTVTNGVASIAINGGESRISQQKIAIGAVTPGQDLVLSFDIKGTAENGAVFNGNVQTFDPTGVTATAVLDNVVPTDTWQTITMPFTVGPKADWGLNILLGPVCGAVAGCAMNVELDNILIAAAGGEPIAPVDPGTPGEPVAGNLVPNGDFASGLTGWESNATIVDGAAFISIEGGESRLVKQKFAIGEVIPGQQYTLSFALKGSSADGAVFNGNVQTFDPTGVSATAVMDNITPTPTWQTYTMDFTAGAKADWGFNLLMGPVCGAVAGCAMDVYIDNVAIVAK